MAEKGEPAPAINSEDDDELEEGEIRDSDCEDAGPSKVEEPTPPEVHLQLQLPELLPKTGSEVSSPQTAYSTPKHARPPKRQHDNDDGGVIVSVGSPSVVSFQPPERRKSVYERLGGRTPQDKRAVSTPVVCQRTVVRRHPIDMVKQVFENPQLIQDLSTSIQCTSCKANVQTLIYWMRASEMLAKSALFSDIPPNPLTSAVQLLHPSCLRLMLTFGAIVGLDVLLAALEKRSLEIIETAMQVAPSTCFREVDWQSFLDVADEICEPIAAKLVEKCQDPVVLSVVAKFAFERGLEGLAMMTLDRFANPIDVLSTCPPWLLHFGVKNRWLNAINYLICDANFNINACRNFRTPLCHACVNGQADIARVLLSRGADPNAFDDTPFLLSDMEEIVDPFLPIQVAISGDYPELVSILLEHGAEFEPLKSRGSSLDVALLSYRKLPLQTAMDMNHKEVARILLNFPDKMGNTYLHRKFQDTSVPSPSEIEALLNFEADPNLPNLIGETPFHVVFKNPGITAKDACEICAMMMLHNANPLLLSADCETPIFCAASRPGFHVSLLRILQSLSDPGTDLNSPADARKYPLVAASENGDLDAVKVLLDHGASPSPMSVFSETYAFISDAGVLVEGVKYASGVGPLEAAVMGCHPAVVGYLLRRGAVVRVTLLEQLRRHTELTGDSHGPLIGAALDTLLKNRVSSDSLGLLYETFQNVDKSDTESLRRLLCVVQVTLAFQFQLAASRGLQALKTELLYEAVACDLADLVAATLGGQAPPVGLLHRARSGAVAAELLAAGADVNGRDDCGDTALHACLAHRDVSLVRVLVDAGANVNAVDAEARTPLQISGNLTGADAVMKFLVSRDAMLKEDCFLTAVISRSTSGSTPCKPGPSRQSRPASLSSYSPSSTRTNPTPPRPSSTSSTTSLPTGFIFASPPCVIYPGNGNTPNRRATVTPGRPNRNKENSSDGLFRSPSGFERVPSGCGSPWQYGQLSPAVSANASGDGTGRTGRQSCRISDQIDLNLKRIRMESSASAACSGGE